MAKKLLMRPPLLKDVIAMYGKEIGGQYVQAMKALGYTDDTPLTPAEMFGGKAEKQTPQMIQQRLSEYKNTWTNPDGSLKSSIEKEEVQALPTSQKPTITKEDAQSFNQQQASIREKLKGMKPTERAPKPGEVKPTAKQPEEMPDTSADETRLGEEVAKEAETDVVRQAFGNDLKPKKK